MLIVSSRPSVASYKPRKAEIWTLPLGPGWASQGRLAVNGDVSPHWALTALLLSVDLTLGLCPCSPVFPLHPGDHDLSSWGTTPQLYM